MDGNHTLSESLRQMAANWHAKFSREDQEAVKKNFSEILGRVGDQRFRYAVQQCITKHATGFFPTVGEFMQYVPDKLPNTSERRLCHLCRNTDGWLFHDYTWYDRETGEPHHVKGAAYRCTHEAA